MTEASFGEAADIVNASNGRRIFQDFSWDQVRGLWNDAPLFKRGVIGAAALAGFSAVYSKFRDRSPEDMQGPPLLPGGSAYEQLPRDTLYPPLTPTPTSQGGVTYKVIADGSYDPNQLQMSIGNILGEVPMIGSFYNTQPDRIPRPRFNQRRSDDELFGGI